MIKLALVEDDWHIRDSLTIFFSNQEEIQLLQASDSVESFLKWLTTSNIFPDVLLLDISLPGVSGIKGIPKIRNLSQSISIIMLTIHDDSSRVFDAFREGANGYLLKNTPLARIKEGILDIKDNGAPMSPSIAKKVIAHFTLNQHKRRKRKEDLNALTEREKDVVNGLVEGHSYQGLASQLNLSIETIRHHIKNIYTKLHVNSKSQVVAKSLRGEI